VYTDDEGHGPVLRPLGALGWACAAVLLGACGPGEGVESDGPVVTMSHAEPDPVVAILAGARRAVGLTEAIPGILADAEVEGPGGRFRTLIHSSAGGGVRMEQTTGFLAAVDGGESWGSRAGVESAPLDAETEAFVRGHELHALALVPETRLTDAVFLGAVELGGTDVLGIRWTVSEARTLSTFFSLPDTLPLGLRVEWLDPAVVVRFHDWTPLDDRDGPRVTLFRRASFRQGDEVFEYAYDRLEVASVPDSLFRRPARR
jgi:hypothetical protein